MQKFFSNIFSKKGSSSTSQRSSFRGSQASIAGSRNAQAGSSLASNMRGAASLDNLSSYRVDPKQLSKFKLHKASWEGDLHKVESLARPNQIDLKNQQQQTPLHCAVASGQLKIVRHLVQEGAKLNLVDNEKRTPLVAAVLSRNQHPEVNTQICSVLLDGGAHPFINAVDTHGKNALHYAIEADNAELVNLFLTAPSCDPNFVNRDEMSPLHLAVQRNNLRIAHMLLADQRPQRADPNQQNRNGQTPLHMAASAGHAEMVRLILQDNLNGLCDPTIIDSQRCTASQLAKANHRDDCAKLIDEYQQHWATLPQGKATSLTATKQQAQSGTMNPRGALNDDDEDESSSQLTSSRGSNYSPRQAKLTSSQRSDQLAAAPKPETRNLADLVRNNPIKPDPSRPPASNQTIAGLIGGVPLQPGARRTSQNSLTQSPFNFGAGSTSPRREANLSPREISIEQSLLAGQPSSGLKTNVAVNALVNALPPADPLASSSNSWSRDPSTTIKRAAKAQDWDTSSDTQSDDEDTGVFKPKLMANSNQQGQPFANLNGTSMFVPASPGTHRGADRSDDEDDSIEMAIRKSSTQPASNGVHNAAAQSTGFDYKVAQSTIAPALHSPIGDESSWSTSSVTANTQSPTKGISALISQQPLVEKKSNASTWDDSRPLSEDLKQNASSSDESDTDRAVKAATIVRVPTAANGTLSNLVATSVRPTETTGVENLTKMMEAMRRSSPAQPKPSTSQPIAGSSAAVRQHDSLSSSNASSLVDDALRASATKRIQESSRHETIDEDLWPSATNGGRDFKSLTDYHSTATMQHTQRSMASSTLTRDLPRLRGSMSSSTSSIQNNIESMEEIRKEIKTIERRQEDSGQLKRQLREMENNKNKFEALYKKNDELLRAAENKLEKEIHEKQNLEWASKNLNMELKSIKQKLQALEEDKDHLNDRCLKLKEERDNYDEKLRVHQSASLQSSSNNVLREEDIEKIKLRHREEMKLLSAENDDLHQRTKQLQSDLQLHKESLDVTIRYKIDLEKALDEKLFLQHELDRLKHERDAIEQEKLEFKSRYDHLQDEIRVTLADRSKLEEKLTHELQEQMKQRQRSTDDGKKYKAQIEQLNMKLGDAEARLLVLQTRNETLLASKDREIKSEFQTLTQRLNVIESEKANAEQRYQNEHREIASKHQHVLHEPLTVLTSTPLSNGGQHSAHSPSSPCVKCDTLQRSYEREHEYRLQTERDNERLRDVVSRHKEQQQGDFNRSPQPRPYPHESEHIHSEISKGIRSETDRVKQEIERLRDDFNRLAANYEPAHHSQPPAQYPSPVDPLRQFYEQELRQNQMLLSKLTHENKSSTPTITISGGYQRTSSPIRHDHSLDGSPNCSICSNSRLLKERLANAIDTSLADQRIKTIRQMPILPRYTSTAFQSNHGSVPSIDLLRQRYYL